MIILILNICRYSIRPQLKIKIIGNSSCFEFLGCRARAESPLNKKIFITVHCSECSKLIFYIGNTFITVHDKNQDKK
jgi:hypothetical protein